MAQIRKWRFVAWHVPTRFGVAFLILVAICESLLPWWKWSIEWFALCSGGDGLPNWPRQSLAKHKSIPQVLRRLLCGVRSTVVGAVSTNVAAAAVVVLVDVVGCIVVQGGGVVWVKWCRRLSWWWLGCVSCSINIQLPDAVVFCC